ncbi:MAG: TIGR01212 family radical SAM protein [Microbacter sp.]
MQLRYNDYTTLLRTQLHGRVQKISINAGFTCPNRDGTLGFGGCTYCNNQSFNPDYCQPQKSVTEQLEEGIRFFRKKHEDQKYIAYFQAYTNTYASINTLIGLYEEALQFPDVVGIAVGTRPDCINNELLDFFETLSHSRYLMVEYGVESTRNETLEFIHRGHTFEQAEEAIRATAERNINTAAHLIIGLPHETHKTWMEHALKLSQLPLTVLKLHQLQIIRGTVMAKQFEQHPEWFHLTTLEAYIDAVIDFLELLSPAIAMERFASQSPHRLLIAPDWGTKNHEFVVKLQRRMEERDTYQGKKWHVQNAPTL